MDEMIVRTAATAAVLEGLFVAVVAHLPDGLGEQLETICREVAEAHLMERADEMDEQVKRLREEQSLAAVRIADKIAARVALLRASGAAP